MGIFKRVLRIAKGLINGSVDRTDYSKSVSEVEDDELRKIIEDLNNPKTKDDNQNKNTGYRQHKSENSRRSVTEIKVRNAYKALGIKPSATNTEIKTAYRNLIRQYHPDVRTNESKEQQAIAMKMTQEINVAYEFLQQVRKF